MYFKFQLKRQQIRAQVRGLEYDTPAVKQDEDHDFSPPLSHTPACAPVLPVPAQKKGESGVRSVLLMEQMETSAEAEDRLGLGETTALGSKVKEGRPGRTLGGSARSALVVAVTVVTVITSGWRPRLRTCPALSREVV